MNLFRTRKTETPYSIEDIAARIGVPQGKILAWVSMGILKPAKMKNGDLKFAEIDVDKAKLQLLLETESDTISKMDDKTFSHLMQNLEKLSQQYQKTA